MPISEVDLRYRKYAEGYILAMRVNRYSWWTHWRELADFFLPRRYRWLVTPNMQSRGSPINQHIIDNTGTFAARNLASGLLSGKSSPARPWFKLKVGRLDSTGTNPISLWLAECERLMRLVFQESNFYNAIATFYYDLVVFGTASMILYEDFQDVVACFNPCAGEYYVDIDGQYRPRILAREFTMSIGAMVNEFGLENCSASTQQAYKNPDGSGKTREVVVAHLLEPNDDDKDFGIDKRFGFRECFFEWGGSTAPQGGAQMPPAFLRKKGYFEQPQVTVRWDLVSNDPYGRSPAMDGLGDQKQLQLESRRKAQAIDKMVNPPLVADIQLKNQPASLLPGGMTYVTGMTTGTGKPAIASIYDIKFPINEITEDLNEVRERLRKVFFNDLFQTASQFETRSNITAVEWDMRKSESMVMLGPVLERIDHEGLKIIIDRVFNMMARANIIPPPPQEIAGLHMDTQFVSMLAQAQDAAQASSIERVLQVAGNIAATDPRILAKIDTFYTIDKYSALLNNDPKMMHSNEDAMAILDQQAKAQQAQQQAEIAEKMAAGAKTLSETDVGGGANALQQLTGA